MSMRIRLRRVLAPALRKMPAVWKRAIATDNAMERALDRAALVMPHLIRAQPRRIEVAITAHCNLRCLGCRYGRDFMPGHQLPWDVVRNMLDDARSIGIWDVRFYGGEPLLHRELPRMIAYAGELGMDTHVTTNGILLGRQIARLHEAGLRQITIGYYGTGGHYDAYVQRPDRWAQLESSVATVRDRFGENVKMRINWLLMRPSCNLEALHAALDFARRFNLRIQVDLIHYSLPYFSEGPDRLLQFRPEDRTAIERVVDELVRLKLEEPDRFNQSAEGLRSIPDWLLLGPHMRVPCDARHMLWVGADGTVQMCYVTFRLGNLHQTRLKDLVFTCEHHQAARDAFAVACPNCHCHYDRRIQKHSPAARQYRNAPAPVPAAGPQNGRPLTRAAFLPVIQSPVPAPHSSPGPSLADI